jgi:hypothetical protein
VILLRSCGQFFAKRPDFRKIPGIMAQLQLIPEVRRTSGFDITSGISTRHQRFAFARLFRALLVATDDPDVSLDEAARRNMSKTLGRWPDQPNWDRLFDDVDPVEEQLPRRMTVVFTERAVGDRKYVVQRLNGVNIGSQLTDNRLEPDDYRCHDVFHLAFAAILGWSPTLRALLKLKRKSRPQIDENEDGARASIIEEGISTWIFNHCARNADFRSVQTLDYALLKAVHELVRATRSSSGRFGNGSGQSWMILTKRPARGRPIPSDSGIGRPLWQVWLGRCSRSTQHGQHKFSGGVRLRACSPAVMN